MPLILYWFEGIFDKFNGLRTVFYIATLKRLVFADEKFALILLSEIDLHLIGGLHFTNFTILNLIKRGFEGEF